MLVKVFLVNFITQYLKRILRFPSQTLEQPSVLVAASTGKAATNINGTTLHSAFHLPITKGVYRKPRDETLHNMRIKYKYLKLLLIDEISMTGLETFRYLNLTLQAIMEKEANEVSSATNINLCGQLTIFKSQAFLRPFICAGVLFILNNMTGIFIIVTFSASFLKV